MRPAEIIGETNLKALAMAGYDIVLRKPEKKPKVRYRFTCPCCGYSALGGELKNVFANFGQAYHHPCIPYNVPRNVRHLSMRKTEETEG